LDATAEAGTVTVVVACHTADRMASILVALDSLRHQTRKPDLVVLVVDHNEALLSVMRDRAPDVTVVPNTLAQGASGARNSGAAASTTELVAFLDDDARAEPEWLKNLLEPFADPAVIGTGGRVEPEWEGERPRWFPAEFLWVVGASYTGMPVTREAVRNVWSESMAVRRTAFDRVDGFRTGFGKTGNVSRPEDTDLCLRMSRGTPEGHWIYVPDAVIHHLVPPSRSTVRFFLNRCLAEGRGKAEMGQHLQDEPLQAERDYVRKVLPRGLARNLTGAHGTASPLAGVALVGGLLWAGTGYVLSRGALLGQEAPLVELPEPAPGSGPVAVVRELDLGTGLVDLPALDPAPEQLWALVRVFQQPLGLLRTPWEPDGLTARRLADLIGEQLGDQACAALAEAGYPTTLPLPTEGFAAPASMGALAPAALPLTVVICSRNKPEGVREVLMSLVGQADSRFSVLVVDNAPGDDALVDVVEAFTDRLDVTRIVEPRPGLSRARNAAVRHVSTELIAWLDDDEVPDRWWTRELQKAFASAPDVHAVSGVVLPRVLTTRAQLWFEDFGGHSKGRGFTAQRFEAIAGAQSPLYPLPAFGVGANMAFRRRGLDLAGPFDEALGAGTPAAGAEDTLAFTRLLLAGGVIQYVPAAVVWHSHREDLAGLRAQLGGYGRGLTAFYTALLLDKPSYLVPLVRLLPQARRDMSAGGVSLQGVGVDFPKDVLNARRRGLLRGPKAYLDGRRGQRAG
jgi:GT2 family glycosyltransferase